MIQKERQVNWIYIALSGRSQLIYIKKLEQYCRSSIMKVGVKTNKQTKKSNITKHDVRKRWFLTCGIK